MSSQREAELRRDARFMGEISQLPSGLLIPHYLIHCALYYHLNSPVISDSQFDELSSRLLREWDTLSHPNKQLIDPTALTSGGHYIKHTTRILNVARDFADAVFQHTTIKERMSINPRTKGASGEREIIKLLQPHVDEVSRHNKVDPPKLQRNSLQSDGGGFDIVGFPHFAIEVKRVEKTTKGNVLSWWSQTVRQAGKTHQPILFYRPNKTEWKVMIFTYLDLPGGKRYKLPSTISVDAAIFYLKCRLHNHQTNSLTQP